MLVSPGRASARDLVRNESGAIVVLFAVLTPALLFLFLLVIDVGN
jgi:Flp pilus assembly protein TadG